MKRFHQLLACYLALCLAGGGTVALSPVLHRLVEHGGHGPTHTHVGIAAHVMAVKDLHQHGAGHGHSHAPACPRSTELFRHSYDPHGLPRFSLARVSSWLSQFFQAATPSPQAPSNDGRGHEHHSLFELLASGMVDQPIDVPILPSVPPAFASRELPPNTPFAAHDWEAQTASRGPPVWRG